MNKILIYICLMFIALPALCQDPDKVNDSISEKSLESYSAEYKSGNRDIHFINEYVNFLESQTKNDKKSIFSSLFNRHQNPKTKILILDYLSKCPIRQLSEQNIWELGGKYLLTDVYSNTFEYVFTRLNKFSWKGNDSRYSILSTLDSKMSLAAQRIASPRRDSTGIFQLPPYQADKFSWIQSMLDRNVIQSTAFLQTVFKIYYMAEVNNFSAMLSFLNFGNDLNLFKKDKDYINAILSFIADHSRDKVLLQDCLSSLNRFIEIERKGGYGEYNYYEASSKLNEKLGNHSKAIADMKKYNAIEAEKMERFGDLFKQFNKEK